MRHRGASASPRPSRARRLLRALLVVVLAGACAGLAYVGFAALTGRDPAHPTQPAATPTEDPIVTNVAVGKVTGKLVEPQASEVTAELGGLVRDYLEWAYLGDYPRTDWSTPPPGFTARAGTLFLKDMRKLPGLTNQPRGASLTKVSQVTENITLDVLAPRSELAGATGRYTISFQADDASGSTVVTAQGRLIMAVVDGSWQIVGYYAGESQEGGQS